MEALKLRRRGGPIMLGLLDCLLLLGAWLHEVGINLDCSFVFITSLNISIIQLKVEIIKEHSQSTFSHSRDLIYISTCYLDSDKV